MLDELTQNLWIKVLLTFYPKWMPGDT